jgi:hypothetical protein
MHKQRRLKQKYEYENNFDYRIGWCARRDVVCSTSSAVHNDGRPQNPLLHLSDAPVGQIGQARLLSGMRDEFASGLCRFNRHECRAIVIGLLLILVKENL